MHIEYQLVINLWYQFLLKNQASVQCFLAQWLSASTATTINVTSITDSCFLRDFARHFLLSGIIWLEIIGSIRFYIEERQNCSPKKRREAKKRWSYFDSPLSIVYDILCVSFSKLPIRSRSHLPHTHTCAHIHTHMRARDARMHYAYKLHVFICNNITCTQHIQYLCSRTSCSSAPTFARPSPILASLAPRKNRFANGLDGNSSCRTVPIYTLLSTSANGKWPVAE